MALKTQWSPRATISVPDGGTDREFSRLINSVQSHRVVLEAEATVDITGAGSAVRNRGSVWALFSEVGIEENGRDRHLYDGRMLRFMSEVFAPSALSATRLTGAGIQTTVIREQAVIWFAHPLSAAPGEVTFRELNSQQLLQAFVRTVPARPAALITGGTATVTDVSVRVVQKYDGRTQAPPVFIPTVRQTTQPIDSVVSAFPQFIKTPHFLRGLFLQQDTNVGEVADIITSFALRGDLRDIIGPQEQNFGEANREQELAFGGDVISGGGYLGLNFQQGGRLSNVINPRDDVNLRFEFSAAPSAAAGATSSNIRVALMELERVRGLVTPQIPFPL